MASKKEVLEIFVSTEQSLDDMLHEANAKIEKARRARRKLRWTLHYVSMEKFEDMLLVTYEFRKTIPNDTV